MASTCFGPLHLVQLRRGTTQVAAIQDTNLPHEVMSECDSLSKGTLKYMNFACCKKKGRQMQSAS